jgi:phytoene dehydrogenase-like protein
VFAPLGRHLEKLGVRIHTSNELVTLKSTGGRVAGAEVRDASGKTSSVNADWYILAVPQDIAPKVLTADLVAADPQLGRLGCLDEQWLGAANLSIKGPGPA